MTRVLFLVALRVVASVSQEVSLLDPEAEIHDALNFMFLSGLQDGYRATLGGLNAYRRAVGISIETLIAGMNNQFDVLTAKSLFNEVQVSSAQV